MRLSESEREKIRAVVRAAAGPAARVRLFGSRTDDRLRGGDIDLLVEVDEPVTSAVRLEARIGARLQRELGDRRIDVLVAAPNVAEQPVHRVARETGIVL
jgi:predicted nucleotidyltransferase